MPGGESNGLNKPMAEDSLPRFETERLVIRPMVASDGQNIYTYGEDPEISKHMRDRPFTYNEQWIASLQPGFANRENATLAITLKTDVERAIGAVVLRFDPAYKEVAECGFWVAKHLWGQGIAYEAARRMVEWGFDDWKCEIIYSRCCGDNVSSVKLVKKLGMTYEGCLRNRLKIGGKYVDLDHYSILRSEYYDKRNTRS